MKCIFTLFSFFIVLFISADGYAQKKVPADFPKEMLPEVKAEYQKTFDKGQILYNINCAKCHTTYNRKKPIVPDFTLDQLKGYELRESNQRHVENIPEEQVSPEELGIIMTFLLYKKRNEPPKK
jgi:mono/diheme cytochrome c family protein